MSRKILESREVFPHPWIILDKATRKELSVRIRRVLEARPDGVRINVVAAWGDGYENSGDSRGDLYVAKYSALFLNSETIACVRGVVDTNGNPFPATFEAMRRKGVRSWDDRFNYDFGGSSSLHLSLRDVHAIRIHHLEPTVSVSMFIWKRRLTPSVEALRRLVERGCAIPQDALGGSVLCIPNR